MTKVNYTNVYGLIGKILCGCAGAIVGFLIGGVYVAVPAAVVGVVAGRLLEKSVLNPALEK